MNEILNLPMVDPQSNMILDLNRMIHRHGELFEYHMRHIQLVKDYALLLNKRLGTRMDTNKITFIAYAHDLFKERALDPKRSLVWNGIDIPQDTCRYVRTNLETLEIYGLDEYFNSSVQYHPLSAGIFLHKELGIRDKEILYPVFFHSCPIMGVYQYLPERTKQLVDIILLSDKLSSNYLRINYRHTPVRVDLDLAVFGKDGMELNYSLGLYLARLIGQGKSTESQGLVSTEHYRKRLATTNPTLEKHYSIKKLGGTKLWPRRKSQAWKMR